MSELITLTLEYGGQVHRIVVSPQYFGESPDILGVELQDMWEELKEVVDEKTLDYANDQRI